MAIQTERLKATVTVDTKKAQAELLAFKAAMKGLIKDFGKETVKIDTKLNPPSTTEGRRQKKIVEKAIGPLNIKMRVDQSNIRSIVSTIKARLASAGTIDISKANFDRSLVSRLKGVTSGFAGLTASMMKFTAIGAGVAGLFHLITGAAGALTSMLGALVGTLSAIPSMLAAVGQGAATLLVAFRGIGTAFSAYGESQASGAKNTRELSTAMQAQEHAARGLTMAQRRLRDAKESQARGAEDAAERVRRAQNNLQDAQEDARSTQERLNDARDRARERLEDLRLEAERAVLSEAQAAESIAQAQQRLMEVTYDPNATSSDVRQAQLDVEDAELRLMEAQEQRGDVEKDLQESQKKGIKGSDEVQNALEINEDITLRLADAQDELSDAVRDRSRQERDSAEAVEDAMWGVQQAHRDLAEAARTSSEAGVGAMSEYQKAMDDLTPSARAFVEMINGFRDAFGEVRESVQEAFFDGLIPAVKPLIGTYLPILEDQLTNTAVVLRGIVQDFSDMALQPDFIEQVKTLGDLNVTILEDMGEGFISLSEGMVGFMEAAAPFTEWFSGRIVAMMERFDEWANSFGGQNAIAGFLEDIQPLLSEIGGLLGDFGTGFMEVARLLIGPTTEFLRVLSEGGHIVDFFAQVGPAAIEVMSAFGEAIGELGPSLGDALVSLKGPLIEAFESLAEQLPRLIPKLGELVVLLIEELVPILPELVDLLINMTEALIILTPVLVPLIEGFTKLLNLLGPAGGLMVVIAFIAGKLGLLGSLFGGVSTVVSGLVGVLKWLAATILGPIAAALGVPIWLVALIIAAIVGLGYVIYRNWESIKRWTGDAWDWIYEKVTGSASGLWNNVTRIFNDLVEFVRLLPGRLVGFLDGIWDFLWEQAFNAKDKVIGFLGEVVTFLRGLPGKVWDALKSVGRHIANAFIQGLNWLIDKWNSFDFGFEVNIFGFKGGVDDLIPDIPFRIPYVPEMAKGGKIHKSGLSLVGENGFPELLDLPRGAQVTPLKPSDMPEGFHGGGDGDTNIYVTVEGNVLTENQLVSRVRNGLTRTGKLNAGGVLAGTG